MPMYHTSKQALISMFTWNAAKISGSCKSLLMSGKPPAPPAAPAPENIYTLVEALHQFCKGPQYLAGSKT